MDVHGSIPLASLLQDVPGEKLRSYRQSLSGSLLVLSKGRGQPDLYSVDENSAKYFAD